MIARIITETSSLARQLRGLVADNRATVGPALAKLERVLDTLRANRDALDESITLTGVYGREFTNLGGTGRFFDGAITYPRGFAICTVEPSNALSGVLDDYRLAFDSGETMTGKFLVARLDYAGDFNGERTYTLSLESSGPVVSA